MGSVNVKVSVHKWHTINIINRKDRIRCYFDDHLYIDVSDDTFTSGKIGLWTKADAVTYFDDLEIKPVK